MKLVVVLMIVLLVFQYRMTKRTDFGQLTEMEKIAQLRRMNEYPSSTYRLANLIEARPEAVAYFKLEKNFLDIFDLPFLFTTYLNPLLLPFFLLGFFEAIKARPKPVLFLTALPVALLTVIGHNNPNGPFVLFPVIYAGAAFGVIILFRAMLQRHEK